MQKTELVAEVGLSHDGSLGIAHSYIDICSSLGIDTIKFQMHIAEAESSLKENFRIPFSYADKNRFSYWDRTSFTYEEWKLLKNHCDYKKINFLVSAFSIEALEKIEKLGCRRIKLGSAETIDPLILKTACNRSFNLILSNGFAGDDIFKIIPQIKTKNNLTILECISEYPSSIKDFNLERYHQLKNIKGLKVGLSDHSSSTNLSKYLISIGTDMIEAHIVFHKKMFGPDSTSSLDINQWSELVSFNRDIQSIDPNTKKIAKDHIKKTFSRSLTYKRDMQKGEMTSIKDFESTKCNGEGISTKNFSEYIHKILDRSVSKSDLVKESDFE